MNYIPTIINGIVISALIAEIVGIALGLISPTQLLAVSFVSGILTLISFRLSKIALQRIQAQGQPEGDKQQAGTQKNK